VPVVFLDYPFWNHNNPAARSSEIIACLAPAERLPAGALVIPVCQALKDSGRPPDELFLDNNHLSALGNKIVGEALAEGIRELGLGP
jgi:lysophospholipase L1-like esterase